MLDSVQSRTALPSFRIPRSPKILPPRETATLATTTHHTTSSPVTSVPLHLMSIFHSNPPRISISQHPALPENITSTVLHLSHTPATFQFTMYSIPPISRTHSYKTAQFSGRVLKPHSHSHQSSPFQLLSQHPHHLPSSCKPHRPLQYPEHRPPTLSSHTGHILK